MLDIKTLENWLWEAACKIRGPVDAPKYKDYILPLIFLKRLSDVFDEEIEKLAQEYGDKKTAEELVEEDHSLVWFYIPKNSRWSEVFKQSTKLGEFLTDAVRAIARENPKLQGVIDIRDFNETAAGQRIITDELLKALIDVLNRHKIGLKDAEPDILGRAYEYLLRKFAEGSGSSAGEFYTPKEVAILMANILDPKEGEEIYDPCLGSGGLLIKTFLRFKKKFGESAKVKPLQFYGQEVLHGTYAMAKMNSFIHKMEANIALGDTMNKPAFLTKEGGLKHFDVVVANPMWNQDTFTQATYENDAYDRFSYGYPSNSYADWGWIQHMFKSLKDSGRMAVILGTGSLSRGSGDKNNKEKVIRKEFVDKDLIECVILLPENLFYNTPARGVIIVINKDKKCKDKITFIDATKKYQKKKPKNYIPLEEVNKLAEIYSKQSEETGISKIISKQSIIDKDYNLTPTIYIESLDVKEIISITQSIKAIQEIEEENKFSYEKFKDVQKYLIENQISDSSKSKNLWKEIPFLKCLSNEKYDVGKLKQKDYKEEGQYPIIDQGKELIAGYSDEESLVYTGSLPVIVFGDHTRILKFIDFPFICGADGTKILIPNKEVVSPLFFYYALKKLDIPSRGYNRHYSLLKDMKLNVPPLPIQNKIENMLASIDKQIQVIDNLKLSAETLLASAIFFLMNNQIEVNNNG